VCITAVIGSALFRFIPLFAVLSLLVPYVLLSGWHVIYTKNLGPDKWDAALLVIGSVMAAALVPILAAHALKSQNSTVAYATLGSLAAVLLYDALRWLLPRWWHAKSWRYEHIYKILSALFGMISAAVGNIFQTTLAQLGPSVIGILVITWFFWHERRTHIHSTRVVSNTAAAR
jgi:hypothetical protein